MKNNSIKYIGIILVATLMIGCANNTAEENHNHEEEGQHESHEGHGEDEHGGEEGHEGHEEEGGHEGHTEEGGMGEVHLSDLKFESLGVEVDTLPARVLSAVVKANGQLEVPPQHEATVTAILGANITDIKVIEGERVRKGQVLAYLSHPNLAELQSKYITAYSSLQFLEQEKNRQKRLNEEEVGSGRDYQQALANYQSMRGELNSYKAQLKQLNLDISKMQDGDIYEKVPVVSPINGYIEKVLVQLGQYVEPQTEMIMIVNNEHVHADLMVFEKDVHTVKEGQRISFTVQSMPGKMLEAEIYSVGKKFEQNPKAVHVHAEIKEKEDGLIPGMYINGRIHTESEAVLALPEEAIIEEEGKPYIFVAEQHHEDGETEWAFRPVEIRTGITEEGWVEIKLLEPLPEGALVAWNGAYYLIAEMKKSQTSHSH